MIKKPVLLENHIHEYAWGSKRAIQELLGVEATNQPWAELWMGAHPKSPSSVQTGDKKIPLDTLVVDYPQMLLGAEAAKKFNYTLPFLFKVLAAAKPLSIQAHPGKAMAEKGFDRENRLNIPLDAPHRNYRDPWPKPEIICAVEPFIALNGFRASDCIVELFKNFCPKHLSEQIGMLEKTPGEPGIREMFRTLLLLSEKAKKTIIDTTVRNAMEINTMEGNWVIRLHEHYPEDIGILSPLFLNLIRLEPFSAMFLETGQVHAYLEGVGIELMANSDNVLRGGLTAKHIDTEELMKVVRFEPSPIEILQPVTKNSFESYYPTKADEFLLSMISTDQKDNVYVPEGHGLEILLCMKGSATLYCGPDHPPLFVKKGKAALVPACAGAYEIKGDSFFFKASIPQGL